MRHEFTAAAQRALAAAGAWQVPSSDAAAALLLGLLAEPESRAALALAERGITAADVRHRWPELSPSDVDPISILNGRSSSHVERLVAEVELALTNAPEPLTIATEHLLLGLLLTGDTAATWLAEHGFSSDAMMSEIGRLYHFDVGPATPIDLPIEEAAEKGSGVFSTAASAASIRPEMLWRILDAAANRAREGLRVIEDFARFGLDDAATTEALKAMRHELAAALQSLPADRLLASRDTPGDVGTAITHAGEQRRPDLQAVVAANFKRLQESLRSLEEYGKLIGPAIGRSFERLRYRSYELERRLTVPSDRHARLAAARLYVLMDGRAELTTFEALARSLITAGVDVIQLRDKQLSDAELIDRGRRLVAIARGTRTLVIMNDRPDLAIEIDADGVHVGQEDVLPAEARRIVGPSRLVGVSTHSLEQALAAQAAGTDYLGVGPVFPSGTKNFAELKGVALLREVAPRIQLPAFAIGGIEATNLDEILAAGFTRVAISGAICRAADPTQAVAELRAILSDRAKPKK